MGSLVSSLDRRRANVQGDSVTIDGESFRFEPLGDGRVRITGPEGTRVAWATVEGRRVFVTLDGRDYVFDAAGGGSKRRASAHEAASGEVTMPMPGLVISVSVSEGQSVKRGDPLLLVEAMKMEHTLRAPRDGVVRRLSAANGQRADAGKILLEVESSSS